MVERGDALVVLVLTACPAGLRGHLTRWLLEISPGVFCGRVSARVRERATASQQYRAAMLR